MLSPRERGRYMRQLELLGDEGQERLKAAHIFIGGAGGLGSPVAIYLAAAGIGTITIVDRDMVDQTNLNRQILHVDRDIGRDKTASAEEHLRAINPDITVQAINATISRENAADLVGSANGIVDAMDNFGTRYLLNDIALAHRIPFFHGAVRGFYGQATTIIPDTTACLRCIVPVAPPKETTQVIGATAGVIGSLQATEVIKYLTGRGRLLANRLVLWDGMQAKADEIVVERNPDCPACGDRSPHKRRHT